MRWMILPLRRYADFKGRSRRLEYWMFQLLFWLVAAGILLVGAALGMFRDSEVDSDVGNPALGILGIVAALLYLAVFIPALAVQVRRFHDRDMSGWFSLLGFIPYVGGLVVLAFMVMPGTEGPNSYGEDPLNPEDHLERVFN